MSDQVYLNGKFIPRSEAFVSVEDRGFLFGDGVYEVLRAVEGRLFAVDFHNRRLERSLEGVRVELPGSVKTGELVEVGRELLRRNGFERGQATLYIQVTRGVATRAHTFPAPAVEPTVYVSVARFTPPSALLENGASAVTHPDLRWGRCDLKTVNLLPNILAAQYAAEHGAAEAILVRDGVITEGSKTNVFGVVGNSLRTHPCDTHILPGITRAVLGSICADLNLALEERPIAVDEIPRLREMFVSGTTMDVVPIVRLDDKPVGNGAPGEITRRLQKALVENLASSGE